jgi:hypothetical protein
MLSDDSIILNNELKECGGSWPNLSYCPGIFLEGSSNTAWNLRLASVFTCLRFKLATSQIQTRRIYLSQLAQYSSS